MFNLECSICRDGSDVFGKAVDVLGSKVQGRVEMGQHVLVEDLQVFDTFSWLTTRDLRSSQL